MVYRIQTVSPHFSFLGRLLRGREKNPTGPDRRSSCEVKKGPNNARIQGL